GAARDERCPHWFAWEITFQGAESFPEQRLDQEGLTMIKRAAAAAAEEVMVAVGTVPMVLGAMGFTRADIAASSLAAKMMSAAVIANGGGVAAGSLVATLQSVGAAGLSTASNILLASTGSVLGALLGGSKKSPPSSPAGPRAEGDGPGENASQVKLLKFDLRSERGMRNKEHLQPPRPSPLLAALAGIL
ncbi:interferon alpha-inducible protein 27-like protein 2, partial [Sturnira hondurensis]|uniref:interferon alpha-inducible protein 27-like protein 2 n=1 Tax=Sturnira hondurensis TaxID=192404 RepID=UPI00187B0863